MMFQPIDPLSEGVNVLEVTIEDNEGEQNSLQWEIEIRSRIEIAVETEGLIQLSRTKARTWNPIFSPDGTLITFESISRNENNIMLMNSDGSNVRKVMEKTEAIEETGMELVLSEEDEYAFGLSWMPDNKRIVFTSSRSGNYEIWLTDISTPEPTHKVLTDNPSFDGGPDCDPITERVAFVSNRDGNPEIFVLDPNKLGRKPVRISPVGGVNLTPRWSPDGKYIAFSRRVDKVSKYDIFLVQSNGQSLINLTADSKDSEDRYPNWSPDATKIAYYSDKSLKVYSFISGKHTVIAENIQTPEVANGPVWSPDGTRIVYTSNEEHYPVYIADLQEMENGDISPESYVIIPTSIAKQNYELAWSSQFNQIVFRSFKSTYWDLWSLRLDLLERYGGRCCFQL